MTLYINNGKDGSPNKLGGSIVDSTCRIEFTEAIYSLDSSGNFGTLTYINRSTTDAKAIAPNIDIKEGDICQVKFTVKDYETEYNGKKSSKKAFPKEIKYHEIFLAQMSLGEAFSGHLCLTADMLQLDTLFTGCDPKGIKMPDNIIEMMQGSGYRFEIAELDKLKDIKVSGGGNLGGKSYPKNQTRLEVLTDNLTFLENYEKDKSFRLNDFQKLALIYGIDIRSTEAANNADF